MKTKTPVFDQGSEESYNSSESAGQSGDMQGISDTEDSNSESVRELLEEGQYYEASVVSGIENAPDADVSEVTTKQVPEDDVPEEYLNESEVK
jgi:hypothetical protein